MVSNSPGRWFTAIPLLYRETEAFWQRDAGLVCLGLRDLGSDSRFVALGEEAQHPVRPLLTVSSRRWVDPAWWRQWNLDGVFFYSWAAPEHEPVARAIKQAGVRLGVRLDSDGTNSARLWPWRYFVNSRYAAQDAGKSLPLLRAAMKTAVHRWFPRVRDHGVLRHLNHADFIAIESPLARERYRSYLLDCGRPDLASRLVVIAHPVQSAFTAENAAGVKTRLIIAVGRWEAKQKDAPLMVEVLGRALSEGLEWRARLIGSGEDFLRGLVAGLPDEVRGRIAVLGPVSNSDLQSHYAGASIQLVSSRFESFHIAAAESLCCGCSVVGPAMLPSLHWFVSRSSGALSATRVPADLAQTLLTEMRAWDQGERDPIAISCWWRQQVAASAVALGVLRAGGAVS